MSANLYVMEAANLFVGDNDAAGSGAGDQTAEGAAGGSLHLVLTELKLPTLEHNFTDHLAGGAPIAYEVDTYIQRMELTFNLAGWQPDVLQVMASSRIQLQHFNAYGVIRERRTGTALRARAKLWGKLGRANPQAWRRGAVMEHEYSIRSINHYELYMETVRGVETKIYYWDWFLNQFLVGTEDINADTNAILMIPTAP